MIAGYKKACDSYIRISLLFIFALEWHLLKRQLHNKLSYLGPLLFQERLLFYYLIKDDTGGLQRKPG